eukprot:1149945-Pelagomonas_calceolata.AAC.7
MDEGWMDPDRVLEGTPDTRTTPTQSLSSAHSSAHSFTPIGASKAFRCALISRPPSRPGYTSPVVRTLLHPQTSQARPFCAAQT